jgi:eukaryotic-like serine/threonine-protein kinase
MNAAPQTAKEIFVDLISNVPPAEWSERLNQACGDDAPLRQRVRRLLQAHENAESFLETPPSAIMREVNPTIDQPLAEKPGTQIGPYKLLQQIGEGGMGVVYMAEQHEPVKRRVALKIIKPGMDTRQVIARFEAERQALSLMDHPNIAKVLDAGTTESGRPYFVMELVKGQPITQYCDEKHLTPRQRLELLLPVCQAIQHAHQKGIIHRDIKPTNILVAEYDQQPVPKVIDFGVAKATSQTLTEKTMFTGLGQIVGTLEYMSPEQAKVNQLDIDTRSDIYSLGVLMYELLTGSTPFDRKRLQSAAFDEMLRIIREEEPPKPSTRLSDSKDSLPSVSAQRQTEPAKLTKLVRGELDWIVMKALEKDRNRRYETANGLAADVKRYLHDEPVSACRPSAGYRIRKFVRRNRAAFTMTSLVVAALVIGTVVSVWQAVRATQAEGLAKNEAERANREATRASEEASKAKTEAATAQAVNNYLIYGLLAQANTHNEPDRDIKLRTVVDRSAASIDGRFPDQPLVEAAIHRVVGNTYLSLRELKQAEQHFRRALEIRRQVLGAEHRLTGESQGFLGRTLVIAGRPAEAEAVLTESIRVLTQTAGPSDDATLDSLCDLAQAMSRQGRHAEADKLIHQVYETRKRLSGTEHIESLKVLRQLAAITVRQGKHQESEEVLREVVAGYRRMQRTDDPDMLHAMSMLAFEVQAQGRNAEAEKIFCEVVELQKRVLGPEHPNTLESQRGLGLVIAARDKHAEAIVLFGELYATSRRVRGPTDVKTLNIMKTLEQEMRQEGRHQQLEQFLNDVVLDLEKRVVDEPIIPADRAVLVDVLTRLGLQQMDQKRFLDAEQSYRRVLPLVEKLSGEFPHDASYRAQIGLVQRGLGKALSGAGKNEAAESAYRQSVLILAQLVSEFPKDVHHRIELGHAYRILAARLDPVTRTLEREQLWREAASQFEAALANKPAPERVPFTQANLAYARQQLAQEFLTQKRSEDAEAAYRRSIEQMAKVTSEPYIGNRSDRAFHRDSTSLCFSKLIEFLSASNRREEASQVCQQAIRFYEKLSEERPQEPYFRQELEKRQAELAKLTKLE